MLATTPTVVQNGLFAIDASMPLTYHEFVLQPQPLLPRGPGSDCEPGAKGKHGEVDLVRPRGLVEGVDSTSGLPLRTCLPQGAIADVVP